jgi:hypothetical protein
VARIQLPTSVPASVANPASKSKLSLDF